MTRDCSKHVIDISIHQTTGNTVNMELTSNHFTYFLRLMLNEYKKFHIGLHIIQNTSYDKKFDILNIELENIIMPSSINKKKQNFDLKRKGINVPRYNFYKYFQNSLM